VVRVVDYSRMIWFLRHGDAEDTEPDSERKLTEKGRRQARNAGAALAALGAKPEVCLASPKLRAHETAELACEALGIEVTPEPRLSGGWFDPIELTAGIDDVLLVGHEPDFSSAVHELTGGRVDMKKGGLAGVQDGELCVVLRPRDTRLLG
jgi:phosphohistidine phosphatase